MHFLHCIELDLLKFHYFSDSPGNTSKVAQMEFPITDSEERSRHFGADNMKHKMVLPVVEVVVGKLVLGNTSKLHRVSK